MASPDLILCIDDEADRYHALSREADPWVVFCSDDPAAVEFMLNHYRKRIAGVCLDHDMRQMDGVWFAHRLAQFSIPVAVTSMNAPGAERMMGVLRDHAVPCIRTPCVGAEWIGAALALFRGESVEDAPCGTCSGSGLFAGGIYCPSCDGKGSVVRAA